MRHTPWACQRGVAKGEKRAKGEIEKGLNICN